MTGKRTNSSNRRNVFFSDCQFLVYLVAQKKKMKKVDWLQELSLDFIR